jgi:Bacterial antitoxin of type II TA system, VapB
MRTTIRLDDDLLREARRHAAATGRTLNALIGDALRDTLGRGRQPASGHGSSSGRWGAPGRGPQWIWTTTPPFSI